MAFVQRWGVIVWDRYEIHPFDANYVHVDDLDYDYGDYCRFGRVEKLES